MLIWIIRDAPLLMNNITLRLLMEVVFISTVFGMLCNCVFFGKKRTHQQNTLGRRDIYFSPVPEDLSGICVLANR